MTLFQICQSIHNSAIGTSIRESDYLFNVIETSHVLGITLMAGTIAIFDLRLLGIVLKDDEIPDVASQVLPLTVAGFILMVISGGLLFWSEAAKMYGNPAFRLKLLLMVLAGLNPLIFHTTVYRTVPEWGTGTSAPLRARTAAVISLVLWSAIIVLGRAIAYFH
jgi:uncharacterized protein DUF6644